MPLLLTRDSSADFKTGNGRRNVKTPGIELSLPIIWAVISLDRLAVLSVA